uniref:Uncharacterized protein n=1 Tax=Oryza sativa subsp. japonica TaxID=39947 RepID=Q69KP8_ORYSJ|nr:hypothetical protein [Oryza sativa Japonica Group]
MAAHGWTCGGDGSARTYGARALPAMKDEGEGGDGARHGLLELEDEQYPRSGSGLMVSDGRRRAKEVGHAQAAPRPTRGDTARGYSDARAARVKGRKRQRKPWF